MRSMSLVTIICVGTSVIVCTSAPPISLTVTPSQRTISAASTNIVTTGDRINRETASAISTVDYKISPNRVVDVTFQSTNPSIPIDTNGSAPFVMPGSTALIMTTYSGRLVQQETYATNTVATATNLLGFVPGSLASNLSYSVLALASGKTIGNWNYNNNNPGDLATNASVWTAPTPISVTSASGPQTDLIAPNACLGVQHWHYSVGNQLSFLDTNGAIARPVISGVSNGPNDFLIYILESNLPPSFIVSAILPQNWTNHITSLSGIMGAWAHNNSSRMDMTYDVLYPISPYGGGRGLQLFNARTNIFGNEIGATAGDSGSPAFFFLGTTNIILFATSSPGDCMGDFVSDPTYWNFLTNTVPISSLNVLNLTSYPSY